MAPMTAVEARAAARLLRAENDALRRSAQERVRASRRALSACLRSYARLSAARARPLPSPWSELEWHPPDAELERVLVPLHPPR